MKVFNGSTHRIPSGCAIVMRQRRPSERLLSGLFLWGSVTFLSCGCLGAEQVIKPTSDLIKVEDKIEPVADLKVSIERGHEAFYTYGCWHCHTLGDEEAPGFRDLENTGPDLADVGNRLKAEDILQSILEPNAVISEPKEEHTENGLSKMPSFNDPAAMGDIKDMVQFLAQCKLPQKKESNILVVSDDSFQGLIDKNKGLVLLDFWAEWCFACYEANPAIEAVAPQFENRLKVFKIEVDENPVLVDKYVPDLMFPCFVIMQDGKVLDRKYGLDKTMDAKEFFKKWIGEFDAKTAVASDASSTPE